MSLPYQKNKIQYAKQLRKNMTPQERHLWYDFLSRYPVRFQRQKVIGCFIADFFCHKARLVIEIDGSQHYDKDLLAYDATRTEFLASHQLTVLRFSNADINCYFHAVCAQIDQTVKEKLTLCQN